MHGTKPYDFMRHHIIKRHVAARSGEEVLFRVASVLEKHAPAANGSGAAELYTHSVN
jgi:hypothetical protein